MNEIYYQIKIFLSFIIFTSFIAWMNFDLMQKNAFHWTDFNWIEKTFNIHTWSSTNYITWDIYINAQDLPDSCKWINKKSMLCLKELKNNSDWWSYNWLPYKPAKNFDINEKKAEKIDNTNCNKILQTWWNKWNWVYTINPSWESLFTVYCDMNTDWWGWTYTTMLTNTTTKNLFDTWNSTKITSLTWSISTKWTINDFWLYDEPRDLMIVCESNSDYWLKYKIPFIIYSFPYNNLSNLTKSNKAWKILYSWDYINAKYNWITWQLWKNWWASSNNYSHIFTDASSKILFSIDKWIQFYSRDTTETYTNTPAYYEPRWRTKSFDTSNYCMLAIR